MAGKYKAEEAEYYKLISSPEWKTWEAQGRATAPGLDVSDQGKHIIWGYNAAKAAVDKLKQEDKQIKNYYKLATGNEADDSVIAKYAQYAGDPAQLTMAIGQESATIKERMGRDATEAEKQYFGKQMEQGGLDLYGLGTFLEGTTEYQTKASDVARGKLATELGDVDQSYLDRVAKQLQAQYSAQGRSGAGAFGSALIGAGKDIATQRTGYLSQLGYGDFQRGQQNLRSDYEAQLARQYQSQQQGAALGQESRARYYGQQDFDRNQAAQERMMRLQQSMQPKSGTFLQNLVPGLISSGAQVIAAKYGQPQSTSYNYGDNQWGGTPYRY